MTDSAAPSSRPVPVREDCWTEEASSTLIEAWGRRYLDLNRGNLRQKDWQQVADIVNARHGQTKKTHRTDVQCKNRIDTIKKKYKVEKARVSASAGMLASSWPFYDRLDELIGSNSKRPAAGGAGSAVSVSVSESLSHSPPMALPLPYPYRKSAPLATAVLPKKRASPMDDSYFRRNYSAVAAAAAAAATADEEEEDEDVREEGEEEDDDFVQGFRGYEDSEDGIRKLARAIRKFGDVYEKVEAEKQNQMIEMEKQRMQLAKDLEVQRMQMFVNMQLQLKKIKIAKGNKSNGEST
uniref:Myb/SANT-like DNA-binding domain-containing protein n=1 Tax=Kalanchoe fedtschenkoi TaxID=63787 RepID=A0A7N0TWW8_KALFE